MKIKNLLLYSVPLIILLSSCNYKKTDAVQAPAAIPSQTQVPKFLSPYDDIRSFSWDESDKAFNENEYNRDDIITFTFNQGTVLKGSEEIQALIMENGKNPGLGIRRLHDEGITGEGVNVAIIDQNLLLDHPEFTGKIVEYYDADCKQYKNQGSMHAPAVTSLLAGETIGTAPGVKVYFAAVPSWKADAKYLEKALDWIIKINNDLPENDKIRVVSVSANPTEENYEPFVNGHLWANAVERAQAAGILVLDVRNNYVTGFIAPAYYDDTDRENPYKCKLGYPGYEIDPANFVRDYTNRILVPASLRTVAEEYITGEFGYTYEGRGGISWAIPYAAGVLALGWQINPELGNEEIINLLYKSACKNNEGYNVIDPVAFINEVKKTANHM